MPIIPYEYYNFSAASNSSNGNTNTANYSSHVNGLHTNDSIGNSPSSLTLNIKSNGSPVGRQSTSTVNTSSSNSSNSLTNSLANLSSPQTTNTSQTNNGQSNNPRLNNLVQQLDYSQSFTTANNSSNNGLVYHAAGQLSNQHQTQSTNLSTGQTSIHSTHHSHHSSTTQNASSIFTNTNSHHNSHHSANSNNNLVIYNNDLPDTKDGLDELCPICMDKVSGKFCLCARFSVIYENSSFFKLILILLLTSISQDTITAYSRVNHGNC